MMRLRTRVCELENEVETLELKVKRLQGDKGVITDRLAKLEQQMKTPTPKVKPQTAPKPKGKNKGKK